MVQPKTDREDLLLSITKNCGTFIEQTHRKAEETLEFKLNKPRKTIHFIPPISIEGSCIIKLTSLEKYNSFLNITEEKNKFELYKFADSKSGGASDKKVREILKETCRFQILQPPIYKMKNLVHKILKNTE